MTSNAMNSMRISIFFLHLFLPLILLFSVSIKQILKNEGLEDYLKYFQEEEVDDATFLSLKSNEIFEIFKRHLPLTTELEADAERIAKVIANLNRYY